MVLAQAGSDLLDAAGCEVLPRGPRALCGHPHHRRKHRQRGHPGGRGGRPGQPREDGVSQLPPAPGRGGAGPPDDRNPAPRITAATGFDALVHAIEAATCLQRNPVSDAFAEKAMAQIVRALPRAVQNGKDRKARMVMANGSLLAGAAFSNSMVGLVHAIGHALGACATWPTERL